MKLRMASVLLCLCALLGSVTHAQTTPPAAPPSLPGFTVQIMAGYTSLQNVQNANGFFSSLTLPMHTFNSTNFTTTVSLRADNFLVSTPSINSVYLGPEFRFQFSQAQLLGGEVFQPFVNAELGVARSSCASTSTCPDGVDASTHFAQKVGGGLDMPTGNHVTVRLFEYDYMHSTLFPGGHITISNWGQLVTGLGFRF